VTQDLDPARLLATATANIRRDYPVHWTHLIGSAADLRPQRELHPVFAGSYDWHSCVHQTWLMARLLRLRPGLDGEADAVAALDELVTAEGARVEAAFFASPEGAYWERAYGWAWLFTLAAELRLWPGGARWSTALEPLTEVLRARWLEWLKGARLPMRVGTHTNTAFAIGLTLDAARATDDDELVASCVEAAERFYAADRGYGGFEPSAADFLSPSLVEADLMRRVLPAAGFAEWLDGFLPDLDSERWSGLRNPVEVDDPTDPYGSHLSGLALSRAWCWRGIGEALPEGHRYAELSREAASAHRDLGLRYVFGYGYAAEHWLGTFSAYLDLGALRA
jgi:hypothetical protein